MLEVQKIITDRVIIEKGWSLRGIKNPEIIVNQIIELDNRRKFAQSAYDSANAEVKNISSSIEQLIKSGEKNKIDELKTFSAAAKTAINSIFD